MQDFVSTTSGSASLRHSPSSAARLGTALGWLGIGMGVAQLLVPRTVTRSVGIADRPLLLQSLGLREIMTGAGILMQRHPAGWLWSRVAGDVIDIALLNRLDSQRGTRNQRLALATAAVAGIAVLDLLAAVEQTRLLRAGSTKQAAQEIRVKKSVVVNRPAQECYRFWRNFENMPRFMHHVASVQQVDATHSHWTMPARLGREMAWTVELSQERSGQQLSWRTLGDAEIAHTGTVSFTPLQDSQGTRLDVDLHYLVPPGKAGNVLARLLGEEPDRQLVTDLRRFRQLIETGEIAATS